MKTDWTLETAQQQLQSCAFVCEGGPLENNIAYQWLVNTLATLKTENATLKKAMSIHTAQRVNRELQAENTKLYADVAEYKQMVASAESASNQWLNKAVELEAELSIMQERIVELECMVDRMTNADAIVITANEKAQAERIKALEADNKKLRARAYALEYDLRNTWDYQNEHIEEALREAGYGGEG